MDGTSMARRGAMMVGILCLGLAGVLGGCNKSNKQLEMAQQESAELRERNAELSTSLREKDTRIAELEGRVSAMAATPPQPAWNEPAAPRGTRTNRNWNDTGSSNETFVLSGDVLFASGQATLKPDSKKELDKVISQIRSRHAGASIRVEGYTDSDPIKKSKWGSNEALSQARADAVAQYLSQKGISSNQITTIGMGSANPKSSKAASRRVEIVVGR